MLTSRSRHLSETINNRSNVQNQFIPKSHLGCMRLCVSLTESQWKALTFKLAIQGEIIIPGSRLRKSVMAADNECKCISERHLGQLSCDQSQPVATG